MLIGQTVIADEFGLTYYGPWMPSQGNDMTGVVQFFKASGTIASFQCAIQTKNREDSDSSASTLATLTVGTGTPGAVSTQAATGCLELVRYTYAPLVSSGTEWVHFRGLNPIWAHN
ncbi:MAG: hypothetical protein KDC98_13785 [Planctomycetes bacterium]|nr:hypothetical protein [Planctomycetota bacterium]